MKVQKVIRDEEGLKKLPQLMEKLQIHKPLIVGGKQMVPWVSKVAGLKEAPVFSGFHANPDLDDALAGVPVYEGKGCDGIVVIGGGSAMDTAKAIKAGLNAASKENVKQNCLTEKRAVPMIAIPSTAGSGAEATFNGVLFENGRKIGIRHEMLRPDGVLLCPRLLDSLPEYEKKSGALDALAQGIESFWSEAATEDSQVPAYLAILGVLDNLKAYLAGDKHAAMEMMEAAYQSGKAIAMTRTTAAHALAYALTRELGFSHGHAVMLTLPVLWQQMIGKEHAEEKLKDLCGKIRLGSVYMGPKLLWGILLDLGMAFPPMPEEKVLKEMTLEIDPATLGNHPAEMTPETILKAYRGAFLPICGPEKQACEDIWHYYQLQ